MKQLSRRAAVQAVLFVSWMTGCSKPNPVKPLENAELTPLTEQEFADLQASLRRENAVDWKQRLTDDIAEQHSGAAQFDPVLVSLLVSFVFGLIKQCLLAQILRQHKAINRRPDGRIAVAMKNRISKAFIAMHPTADETAVTSHVESSLDAFCEASEFELRQMYIDQITNPSAPSEDDWTFAAVAKSLVEVDE